MTTRKSNKPRRDVQAEITETIIKQIEDGAGDFSMPWHQSDLNLGLPMNAMTGNTYRGINIVSLWVSAMRAGYASDVWGTYKQWEAKGAQVRKGERASTILFYKEFHTTPDSDDANDDGRRFVARASSVFNSAQVDGYEAPTITIDETPNHGPIDRISEAEAWVSKTGANILHGGHRAYYRHSTDTVQMPDETLFMDTETSTRTQAYYSTMMHELTHWSGAKKRLDRTKGFKFGDNNYAFEELVAELGAAFLCAKLGIENEPRLDHAQYIDNWLTVLRNDKRAIVKAASLASKAVDFLDALDEEPPKVSDVLTTQEAAQFDLSF